MQAEFGRFFSVLRQLDAEAPNFRMALTGGYARHSGWIRPWETDAPQRQLRRWDRIDQCPRDIEYVTRRVTAAEFWVPVPAMRKPMP